MYSVLRAYCVIAAAATLLACGGSGSHTPATPGGDDAGAPGSWKAVANALDPGTALPSLSKQAPGWLISELEKHKVPAIQIEAELDALLQAEQNAPGADRESIEFQWQFLQNAAVLTLALELTGERPEGCALACWSGRRKAFRLFDLPMWRDPAGLPAQILNRLSELNNPADAEGKRVHEFIATVRAIMAAAHKKHRLAAANVIRLSPGKPAAIEAAVDVASAMVAAEEFDLARDSSELAVKWRGDKMALADLTVAASICFSALDLACGDRNLAAAKAALAKAADPEGEAAVTQIAKESALAHGVPALEKKTAIEDRLALGKALLELDRIGQANKVYEDLRRDHPRDSRPYVGLGEIALRRGLRFDEIAKLMASAQNLDNRDRDFYQMAVGTWFAAHLSQFLIEVDGDKLSTQLQTLLPQVRTFVTGLTTFEPARGEMLASVLDVGQKLLPALREKTDAKAKKQHLDAIFVEGITRAGALRKAHPDSVDVARLALVLAMFDPVKARALATASDPGLATLPDVTTLRYDVLYGLAVAWNDPAIARSLATTIETAGGGTPELTLLVLDTRALIAKPTDRAAWTELAGAYADLAPRLTGPAQARAVNNLGVSKRLSGDDAGAREAFALAIQGSPTVPVAAINLYAVEADAAIRTQLWQGIETALGQTDRPSAQLLAHRWRIQYQEKTRAARRKELVKAETDALAKAALGRLTDGNERVIMDRDLALGIGFSNVQRLMVQLKFESRPWLIVPAPKP